MLHVMRIEVARVMASREGATPIAREYGPEAAAGLLTGMGRDGALGLLALRQSGAATIAQDEATSVIYGMPREAAQLGAADRILPLGEIGPALGELVRAKGQSP